MINQMKKCGFHLTLNLIQKMKSRKEQKEKRQKIKKILEENSHRKV